MHQHHRASFSKPLPQAIAHIVAELATSAHPRTFGCGNLCLAGLTLPPSIPHTWTGFQESGKKRLSGVKAADRRLGSCTLPSRMLVQSYVRFSIGRCPGNAFQQTCISPGYRTATLQPASLTMCIHNFFWPLRMRERVLRHEASLNRPARPRHRKSTHAKSPGCHSRRTSGCH